MYGAAGFSRVEEEVRAISLEAVHPLAEVVFLRELVDLAETVDIDRLATEVAAPSRRRSRARTLECYRRLGA
jgi:hypothetical protein